MNIERNIEFKPLTPAVWKDFELLFGERGACGGCWCMSWRLTRKEFDKNKGTGNKSLMKKIVEDGKVPGLIAYVDGEPAGWCSLGPREDFPALERSRILARVDELPVWSVSCFFVSKKHRRKGIPVRLIDAAIEFARSKGALILEAYPFDYDKEKLPDPFVWTGICKTFKKAGFYEAARRSSKRPIMRYDINSDRING